MYCQEGRKIAVLLQTLNLFGNLISRELLLAATCVDDAHG